MKCFVLSLHRSGTSSVTLLLERLGIRTIHWPGQLNGVSLTAKVTGHETDLDFVFRSIEPAFAGYQAASDVPLPVLYRQLGQRYPEAKWVLFERPPQEWVRSVRKHVGQRELHSFERVQYWHYFPTCPQRLAEISDSELESMYRRHSEAIRDYATHAHMGKLGVFQLNDAGSASALARFLGKPGSHIMPRLSNPLRLRWPVRRARAMAAMKRSLGLMQS